MVAVVFFVLPPSLVRVLVLVWVVVSVVPSCLSVMTTPYPRAAVGDLL